MQNEPLLPFPIAPASPPGRFGAGQRRHNFADSLAISNQFADADWWMDIYRAAFATMISAVSIRDDAWGQRAGIDRLITLRCGRVLAIDEKIRLRDWPDVLLEIWSDEERAKPGWAVKPLAADFVCYCFVPSRRGFLLPLPILQRAWRDNGEEWTRRYGVRRAQNEGYESVNVPVPLRELSRAMTMAMLVELGQPQTVGTVFHRRASDMDAKR